MGENHFENLPVALYAVNLMLCAVAYFILQKCIMAHHTYPENLAAAMKKQEKKIMLSLVMYIAAIPLAFVQAGISELIFIAVSILWVIPDRNIEKVLHEQP